MYAKIRNFMRENREKPIIGFFYRHLKIHEKKRHLKTAGREIIVDLEGTKEIYRKDREWLELVRAYIQGKTLDVGSKYGLVTKDNDVVALDIIKEYLRINVHANKILADARNLPFTDESFATVVATEILEHLEHPDKAVKEIKRVLKNNGRAIISVPNRYSVFSEVEHIQYFTERRICHLFKDCDVVVCSAISTGHIFSVIRVIK